MLQDLIDVLLLLLVMFIQRRDHERRVVPFQGQQIHAGLHPVRATSLGEGQFGYSASDSDVEEYC